MKKNPVDESDEPNASDVTTAAAATETRTDSGRRRRHNSAPASAATTAAFTKRGPCQPEPTKTSISAITPSTQATATSAAAAPVRSRIRNNMRKRYSVLRGPASAAG